MRTVLVTDVRYRTALAVLRPLARAGYRVVAVQTSTDSPSDPPAFVSRYVCEAVRLDGSVKDGDYADRLLALCGRYERPVLFPIGADTLAMLSKNARRFAAVADFLCAPPAVLDAANDKAAVAQTCAALGIPTPRVYERGELPRFPVIVKPRCGEKLGLHAEQRYARAQSAEEFARAYEIMAALDDEPVVQELIAGDGMGVCVVMQENLQPAAVFCHRRIREYPISGGPSACCRSVYDGEKAEQAVRLLQGLHFVGIAMVEFKGDCVLEINPRIWGSFPLTEVCGSRFAACYVRAAGGESFAQPDADYRRGRRMRFLLNDTLSCLSYLRHGRIKTALGGCADVFRAREAIFRFTDQRPFWRYLWQSLRKKGGGV